MLRRGFTLLEIVIVLAVASLIIIVVFLGVSNGQRSQRDQFRKDTLARVFSIGSSYAGNNSGNLPPNADSLKVYLSAPSGTAATCGVAINTCISSGGVNLTLDATLPTPTAVQSCTVNSADNIVQLSEVSAKMVVSTCLEVNSGSPYQVSQ